MAPAVKHSDHDFIVARHERYVEAYRSGSAERMMEFMDKEVFKYSDFGGQREDMSHSTVKDQFTHTFSNFHDLKIKTISLHGHKHFTAWEWVITCKHALGQDGKRMSKEEAPPKKLIGCTLMWWNDKDKIVKNHDYTHAREP
ncbi:hypothetical protein MMC30_005858 [Trapelia coarctata]|nr:hypothetical protein [Trapelia coarctata]